MPQINYINPDSSKKSPLISNKWYITLVVSDLRGFQKACLTLLIYQPSQTFKIQSGTWPPETLWHCRVMMASCDRLQDSHGRRGHRGVRAQRLERRENQSCGTVIYTAFLEILISRKHHVVRHTWTYYGRDRDVNSHVVSACTTCNSLTAFVAEI